MLRWWFRKALRFVHLVWYITAGSNICILYNIAENYKAINEKRTGSHNLNAEVFALGVHQRSFLAIAYYLYNVMPLIIIMKK